MADIKTQAQISQQYFNLVQALNPSTLPNIEGTDWWVKAMVYGGLLSGVYQDIYLVAQNTLPLSASGTYIDRYLASFALPPRRGALPALGTATLSTTQSSAVTIPAGTVLSYAITNSTFYVSQDTTIAAGQLEAIPFASNSLGSGTQVPNGALLNLQTPIGAIKQVLVSTMTDGANAESDSDCILRLAQALQNPKTGGSVGDYIQWALSVMGVTGAEAYPNYVQAGTVVLSILAGGSDDDTILATPPSATQYYSRTAPATLITSVANYVETKRPVNDSVLVNTVDTYLIQMPNVINVGVRLVLGLALNTILSSYSLSVTELIQREVRRAIISSPVGGTVIDGNRYLLLADIERTLDTGLSGDQTETGIYASILLDRQVDYNGSTTSNILIPTTLNTDGNMPFVYDVLYSAINVYLLT